LFAIYYCNWRILRDDVQGRIISLASSIVRIRTA